MPAAKALLELLSDADRNWEQASNEGRQAFARSLFSEIVYDLDTRRIVGLKLKPWVEPYLQMRAGIESSDVLPEGSSVQAVRWLAPQDAELLVLRCTSRNRITRKKMPHNHLAETDRNAEIMLRCQAGESSAALAREFGVSDRRIRRIIQRYG
jgi:hypothetical protein